MLLTLCTYPDSVTCDLHISPSRVVSADEHVLKAVSVTGASTTIWLGVALALKYTLRLLFMYRGETSMSCHLPDL